MKLIEWKEGLVKVRVPDPSVYPPSSSSPVFFNPQARLSRDLSVLAVRAAKPPQVADAMCGTGIRGIRYAVESGVKEIVFNDINPLAVEITKENAHLNGVEGEFLNEDANILFHERRFAAIDLDPFGPPSPFLQALARSSVHNSLVLVTATDTSPLSGLAPQAAMRKYHTVVKKVHWHRELAVRVLLGYVQHHFNVWEKAFVPLFSYFVENHVRVVGKVVRKMSAATEAAQKMRIVNGVGPIWTGELHDKSFLHRMEKEWEEYLGVASLKLVRVAREEIDTVGYYDLHAVAREIKRRVPPVSDVIDALRSVGFRASRSSLEPRAVKTDAPEGVIKEIILELTS